MYPVSSWFFFLSVGLAEGVDDQLDCSLEDCGDIGEGQCMMGWVARGVACVLYARSTREIAAVRIG